MLIIVSPAKTLDFAANKVKCAHTIPGFLDESLGLINILRKKSSADLEKLMDISEKLAELNAQRYRDFHVPFDSNNAKPAIFAFKGDVYQGLDIDSYNKKDIDFAQKHLRIISGLYGLLRPLDLIQPYRLEMGTELKTSRGKNLYEFWGDKITETLNSEMHAQNSSFLVNLASGEYFKAVREKKLAGVLLNVTFKEKQGDDFKIIGLFAKKARGRMASYIIKNELKKMDDIKDFSEDGYKFNKKLSAEGNFVFTRSKP